MKKEKTKKDEKDNGELNGLDGYYYYGEVNKQTLQGNTEQVGEVDQFSFRLGHSVAEESHGPPDYNLEESWREWGKFSNDDFSKAAGLSYHDQALEKAKKEELVNLLNDTLEIENLSITLIGPNVFVSGQAQTEMSREQINDLIKSVGGLENVVNHLQLSNEFSKHGPQMTMKKDLGLDGGMYEA
ncbi:MAG TPA: BON domain-containing protein [Bacteriovoracaceae bacterium]|nr:BON domain-containing protein [Bacteriovoracaceae bacterium]